MKLRFLSILCAFSVALILQPATDAVAQEDPAPETDADSFEPSANYVHKWIPLPGMTGLRLRGAGNMTFAPKTGVMSIIFFVASYCIPCQELAGDFRQMQKKYSKLPVQFVYVFAHDTRDDAEGFMKEFGIEDAILVNHEILYNFHNPPLPTVYIGDRHGWLAGRFESTSKKDLPKLRQILSYLTSY